MNKESFLFGIIGLLLGLIVGFMVANSINQRGYVQGTTASTTSDKLPPDHPPIDTTGSGTDPGANLPALKQSEARADSNPQSFDAQMEAGMLAYELKNFPDALRYLERARQLKPDDFDVLSQLGNVNFDSNNFEVAEKWYTAALAKKPEEISVRTDLGLTFMFRQKPDYDRAIAEFRRSLQTSPNHEQTLQNLVVALTKKGDTAEAQATLDKLTKVNPQNPAIPELKRGLASGTGPSPASSVTKIPTH